MLLAKTSRMFSTNTVVWRDVILKTEVKIKPINIKAITKNMNNILN